MYMSILDAAKALKMQPSTIKRKVKQGLIPAHRLGGSTSPLRIDIDEFKRSVRGLTNTGRDMALFSGHNRNPCEEAQYDELNRRCVKVAGLVGPGPIFSLLKSFEVRELGLLHPKHYPSFRGKLLRLTRGLQPKEKAA